MSVRPRLLGVGLLTLALLPIASVDAQPKAPDPVLLRVGDSTLTLGEVERRVADTPAFQLAELGTNANEIRRAFVERVLVPELLLNEQAKRKNLQQNPDVRARTQTLLVEVLEQRLRAEVLENGVNDKDVADYFEREKPRLSRPKRLRLSRLLAKDRAEAEKLLERAKQITELDKWRDLVREHSLDKATHMRGGELGFVHPDGNTDVPQVRVAPALYRAASEVNDGELVKTVVPEGDHFAIVWRRGTLDAVEPNFEREAPRIRRLLVEDKLRAKLSELVGRLSQGTVLKQNQSLLDELSIDVPRDPRLPAAILHDPKPQNLVARPAVSAGETGTR